MEDAPIELRDLLSGDAPAVARLSRQLGYEAGAEQVRRRMASILANPDHAGFVAEAGGEVAGWIHVFAAPRLGSDTFAEIGGLVVDEHRRGSGIGRRLLRRAELWASERSFDTLRVRTNRRRLAAQEFYEHLGYRCSKEQVVFTFPLDRPPRR